MIRLEKDGIWYSNSINPKHEDYINEKVDSLIPYLSHVVEIGKDFTLGDLFKIIELEKDMYNTIFSSHLGHYPLDNYINDINVKNRVVEEDGTEIDSLEVYWTCEIWNFDEMRKTPLSDMEKNLGMTEDDRADGKAFDFFCGFHGKGRWKDDSVEDGEMIEGGIAIGFTHLSELKDFLLVLDESVKVYEYGEDATPKSVLVGDKRFTVYDIIGEILSEVSFYGLPEEKEEILEEIIEERDKVKEKIEEAEEAEEESNTLTKKAIKKIRDGKDLRSDKE
jgi:hypothetical protein